MQDPSSNLILQITCLPLSNLYRERRLWELPIVVVHDVSTKARTQPQLAVLALRCTMNNLKPAQARVSRQLMQPSSPFSAKTSDLCHDRCILHEITLDARSLIDHFDPLFNRDAKRDLLKARRCSTPFDTVRINSAGWQMVSLIFELNIVSGNRYKEQESAGRAE